MISLTTEKKTSKLDADANNHNFSGINPDIFEKNNPNI